MHAIASAVGLFMLQGTEAAYCAYGAAGLKLSCCREVGGIEPVSPCIGVRLGANTMGSTCGAPGEHVLSHCACAQACRLCTAVSCILHRVVVVYNASAVCFPHSAGKGF